MKKTLIFGCSILAGLISTSVFADDAAAPAGAAPAAAPAGAAMTATGNMHPCKNIEAACKAAGFEMHGPAGKGMIKDCMKPILGGQSVTGVTVDAGDVTACQAKREAHNK